MKFWRKKNSISAITAIGLSVWGGMSFGAWTYDPTAKTLTDEENGIKIVVVSCSGINLTIGQNYRNDATIIPDGAVLDFTEPITNANDSAIAYKLVSLGDHSLRGFNMKKVILPTDDLSIGDQVFRGCTKLEEIVVPKLNSGTIGAAFSRAATALKDIRITATEKCTKINGTQDARVFAECTALTNIVIDAPALTSSGFTNAANRIFYKCTSLSSISILSRNELEFIPIAFDVSASNPLSALKTITFSGPACKEAATMDALIGAFATSAERQNAQIRVSVRQDRWMDLAAPLTDEEKVIAPQGAFGKFYNQTSNSWVWAVNEPSKYDIDDGVGIVTIEGALGVGVGSPTPAYQEATEMELGDTFTLSAPNWEDQNTAYRYVCESIAVYTWDSDVSAWNAPTITEGNTLDYTVVEGKQKIRLNYVLDSVPMRLEVKTQGNESCTVTLNPAPEDGYIKAGTVTLTATSSDNVPFGRWIGVGLTEEQTRNPVLTVDAASAMSILAVFDTPWVLNEAKNSLFDGCWHIPVTVSGNNLTATKRHTPETNHVLNLSKAIEPAQYKITALGASFATGSGSTNIFAKEVILPTTLESIGGEAFFKRGDITNFVLNCPSLKTINYSAFRECPGNKSSASKWDLSAVKTLGNDAFRQMGMRGELSLPALSSVGSGTLRDTGPLTNMEVGMNIKEIPDLTFYKIDTKNLVVHSSATGMTYRVFEGNLSRNLVLDMPNLEVWGYQTPNMTNLTNVEYHTSKQLRILEKENATKSFQVKNLKTARFSGPLPTAEFFNLMLGSVESQQKYYPVNYQVTIIASKKQAGWLDDEHIRECTDEEYETYHSRYPDDEKRPMIYTNDNDKKAFVRWQKSEFDPNSGLLVIIN